MRETSNLAILFADISGSTRLYEALGSERAREITSGCINLLAKIAKEFQGRIIKTIGDELMCAFPSADAAGKAAVRMQETISDARSLGASISIRVGFNFGEVIEENSDVFGDTVNVAAHIASQAKAEQVLTSSESVELMSVPLRSKTRFIITTTVKGRLKPLEIFELTWGEEEDLTVMSSAVGKTESKAITPKAALKLSFQDKELKVGESLPSITIGRGEQNTLCVSDTMVSRIHVRIEYRRGRFILIDQSTNGTYLLFSKEGKKIFVHREELHLEGDGVIGLGKSVMPDTPEAVHFYIC
ncbi:MAG: adenylate/guanylate cyclase domain-containing protein [Nitrospinae bacterium]|nr:adenylate/guanylate cyclase domain-containing protein [Nitrospinota bacterium]